MPRLYIEYLGDSIELPRGETVVGREVGCALRFNDPTVSRRHLRFVVRLDPEQAPGRNRDEAFVEDLASANGTLLNGHAISAPIRIHDGDVISVGARVITVRLAEEDEAPQSTLLLIANQADLGLELEMTDGTAQAEPSGRAQTRQMARVTAPPEANQRCPACAAPVSDADDSCAACGHRWGGFRPSALTMNPPVTAPAGTFNPLDLRRHNRYSVELRLIYVSSELEIEATTRDLSSSGVFVRTQILDPVSTPCELTILIDGGPPLRVRGVVRRVVQTSDRGEPIGLGVELIHLTQHDQAWIEAVLARSAP